ncbi:MAG: 4-hydroxy-3-methylbut-2-enyl diphosphate reductase [Marmoricola sp.]
MTPRICAPLRSERVALHGRVPHAHLVRTGRSAGTTADGPVLVAGVAGALAALAPGTVVVADEVRRTRSQNGVASTVPSHAWPLLAGAVRRAGLPMEVGPVLTADGVVRGRAERSALARSGALAVDTESALLARDDGTTAVLRVVVDSADAELLRPGTILRGVQGLRTLRRLAPVADAWAAAVGEREVLLAGPRSFCAGVERAVEIVERALERHGAPVYVRRQIVHNTHVVGELEDRGAVFVQEVEEVPRGSVAVLAAHGVTPQVRADAAARDLTVIDATCPLVAKVHTEVRRFADQRRTVLLIGHPEHEEVVGTRGEAPEDVVVVADPAEAGRVQVADPERVAYAMQTTLAVEEAEATAAVLQERFPAIVGPHQDDICYATSNRQRAVREVARRSELVLVVGSANSSNSLRLAEVAQAEGATAYLVDDVGEVDLAWLAGVTRVGVTAGASAPPHLVDDLVLALSGLGPVTAREHRVLTEDVQFGLPKELST